MNPLKPPLSIGASAAANLPREQREANFKGWLKDPTCDVLYSPTDLQRFRAELAVRLIAALDERGLWSMPIMLNEAADHVDCGAACERIWRESDTNAAGCYASERGAYCANDLAETLRELAKVRRELAKFPHGENVQWTR